MALAGVSAAKQRQEEKRKAATTGGRRFLKLDDKATALVRFLEQDDDFTTIYVHGVPKLSKNGKRYTQDVVCLDQEEKGVFCPGCKKRAEVANPKKNRDYARRFKFYVNIIWHDAPLYKFEENDEGEKRMVIGDNGPEFEMETDDEGNEVVKRGPVLALWSGGIRAAEELDHVNSKYKGLMSRPFEVERDGTGLDTTYKVGPAVDDEGNAMPVTPLLDFEEEMAENKYDLSEYTKKPDPDNYFGTEDEGSGGDAEEKTSTDLAKKPNPFQRKRS